MKSRLSCYTTVEALPKVTCFKGTAKMANFCNLNDELSSALIKFFGFVGP